MSAVTRPKGPLPARVYWIRRTVVLAVAALLVFTLARVLTGGSDGDPGGGTAAQLASGEQSEAPEGTPEETASAEEQTAQEKKAARKAKKEAEEAAAATPTETPLPEPTGECRDDDIVVNPVVVTSAAGSRVEINLELTTREAIACTWSASRSNLVVNITSGKDDIWTTRQCPGGLKAPVPVIVRQETPAVVPMHWSGRRSDAECSNLTKWAMPGFYHVEAAAYSGEPTSVQFELGQAQPATVTKTVQPKPKAKDKKKKKKRNRQGSQPTEEPLPETPNGAIEPD